MKSPSMKLIGRQAVRATTSRSSPRSSAALMRWARARVRPPRRARPTRRLRPISSDPLAKSFIDLREPGASVPPGHVHASAPGYRGLYGDEQEIWLPYACFERIAGGPAESHALKAELHAKKTNQVRAAGPRGCSFSIKRDIPGLGRLRVIALRAPRSP